MNTSTLNTSSDRSRFIGWVIVGIVFGAFGLWSLVAPLEGAALAAGSVEVKGNRKAVQHLEGGIVRQILVREGDLVERDALLIKLDDTQAQAELDIGLVKYYLAAARHARLRAEQDKLKEVAYPDWLLTSDDPRAQDAIRNQTQLFQTRQESRDGQVSVLNQRIEQLHAQTEGVKGLVRGKEKLVASYQEEVDDLHSLLEEDFVRKDRVMEMERNLARTESELAEHQATIASLGIKVGETRLEILQLTRESSEHIADELALAQSEEFDMKERVDASKYKAARIEIRSPVAGRVLGLNTHTIGGVIGPGEPVLYVVPEEQELIVSAQVNPKDIDRVEKGQLARVRFSAFKAQTTPVVEGRVLSISADTLLTEDYKQPYFLARVEVTEEGLDMLGDLKLVPGMPAEVLINTGRRTLFQYLSAPVSNAFARSMIED